MFSITKCVIWIGLAVHVFLQVQGETFLDQCSLGWTYYRNGRKCFKLFQNPMNYWNARTYCRKHGGDLASIPDSDTYWFVTSAPGLLVVGSFIIGFNDLLVEGDFRWSDGSDVNYTRWSSGEPNNLGGDEDCTSMYQRNDEWIWNDVDCQSRDYFLCQIRLQDLSTTTWRPTTTTTTMSTTQTTSTPAATSTKITTRTTTSTTIMTTEMATTISSASLPFSQPPSSITTKMTTTRITEPITQNETTYGLITTPLTTLTMTSPAPLIIEPIKTSLQLLSSLTSSNNKTVKTKYPCRCGVNFDPNMSDVALAQITSKIQKELRVNITTLSSARNKKKSTTDARHSSQTLGVLAIIFMVFVSCLVLGFDLITLCWHPLTRQE